MGSCHQGCRNPVRTPSQTNIRRQRFCTTIIPNQNSSPITRTRLSGKRIGSPRLGHQRCAPGCLPCPFSCRYHRSWSRHHKIHCPICRLHTTRARTRTEGQAHLTVQRFLPDPRQSSTPTHLPTSQCGTLAVTRGGHALQKHPYSSGEGQSHPHEVHQGSSNSATPIHHRGLLTIKETMHSQQSSEGPFKTTKSSLRKPPRAARTLACSHEDHHCIANSRYDCTASLRHRYKPPTRRHSSAWAE
jgi:hypothetical protein